ADPGIYDGGLAVRLARAIGLDAAWVPAGGFHGLPANSFTWPDTTRYVDEWGTGYQVGADSWPLAFPQTYPVHTMADWQAVIARHPDPHAAWRVAYAQAALAEARQAMNGVPGADAPGAGDLAVVAGIRGPFSATWMLMGLQQLSFSLVDEPALLDAMFADLADFWTEVGLGLAAAGIDALVIHDDQGSGTSTFIAPRMFRRHVLPHLRRQIQALATKVPVILHSCGNINGILPDLIDCGISGLNNLQRSAGMDLAAVKAAYGRRLCLIGNVDATNVMPYASPAEVEAAVKDCLAVAAPGGAYVLATDHSFHGGIPPANVAAFVAAGHRHGRYAL
ncbi:MAG TPA: uroporphyrinogen decarboxylase family protein, partial [Anaerolineae bacterium]